ncbi:MAG TPA: hypothetical protein VK918_06015 [Pyrinomonadaceae bacterium]|nr:hypothetical protein [Pyrinomonadaceae bacterium]
MPEYLEIDLSSGSRRAAVWFVAVLSIAGAAFAAVWGMATTAASGVDTVEAAEMTVSLAPGDPGTHSALAELLELSFDPTDFEKALAHYETAAALSPYDYLRWQELGRARERRGDAVGGEGALRVAAVRAPHYASVAWVLGNNLLRQGRAEEAFAQISRAVAADSRLTAPAADLAWRIFDGDLTAIRNSIGASPRLTAAIAVTLADQKRFDESFAEWRSIPVELRRSELAETGTALAAKFYSEKLFRYALIVGSDSAEAPQFEVGRINNPGFEEGMRADRSAPFEWSIGKFEGVQVVPTNGQRRSGNISLAVVFSLTGNGSLSVINQTVAVEPGSTYTLRVFYRAELKTGEGLRWTVVNAKDGTVIATTEAVTAASDWSELRTLFTVPAGTDGIIISFGRDTCTGTGCSAAGTIWFDDLELIKQ